MNATPKPFSPDRDHGQIMSDSGVYRNGEGYERTMMFRGWRARGDMQLAQVRVRVDRYSDFSYAIAEVWNEEHQSWVMITRLNPKDWWHRMQGYLRAANRQTEIDTRMLILDAVDELQTILM